MVVTGVARTSGWLSLVWLVLAMALAAAFVIAGPASNAHAAHPASDEPAGLGLIPAGGGFLNSSSDEAGSYAFSVRRGDAAYLVTARHVAPRGTMVYGPAGLLGDSSVVSASRDTSYVRLTGGEPSDRVQIATTSAGAPVSATIDNVASRGSIEVGQRVCHSGYAESTQDLGGFVCGDIVDVPKVCRSYRADDACEITMRSDAGQRIGWLGDSGGPVWQSVGSGRVRLLGVFTSVSAPDGGPPTLGHFVPAFDVLDDLGGVPVSATS